MIYLKKVNVFCFGDYQDYWSKHNGNLKVGQKATYDSIKEEVTNNKILSIPMPRLKSAYDKAILLLETSPTIKSLKPKIMSVNKYGMQYNEPPSVQHILSVILYTDFDTLSFRFSQTFRRIPHTESDAVFKMRANEFWNWRKTLIETVNAFGNMVKDSNVNVYYHDVSKIYFQSFYATFNSPTSTTTQLQVAYQFATNDGIVLEIGNSPFERYRAGEVSCFNCMFVSASPHEGERLFIQPYDDSLKVAIISIRNISDKADYRDQVQAIQYLQNLFRPQCSDNKHTTIEDCQLVKNLCFSMIGNKGIECSEYIKNTMKYCFDEHIIVNMADLEEIKYDLGFYDGGSKGNHMIKIDVLCSLLGSMEKLTIKNAASVYSMEVLTSMEFAEMLGRVNQISCTLRSIMIYKGSVKEQGQIESEDQGSRDLNDWSMCISKNWKVKHNSFMTKFIDYAFSNLPLNAMHNL